MTYIQNKRKGRGNNVKAVTWWTVIEEIKEERRTKPRSDISLHASFNIHADDDTIDNLVMYMLCRRTFED